MDDTSLIKTATAEEYNNMASVLKLTSEMKEISQNFERELFSTGGSLNLKKCFCYLISWRWEADGSATMVKRDQLPSKIYMTQGYKLNEKAQIFREECDIAKRPLGCWINQAGKMTHKDPTIQTGYTARLGQAQAWATSIVNSNLTRKEAHMVYHGVIQAKIGYALPVTTFTEQELRKIQRALDVAYCVRRIREK